MPEVRFSFATVFWNQVPVLVWLVGLWMLLWQQFTWLAFITGLIVAVFVTRVFRLPTVSLGGRLNLWHSLVFIVRFLIAVVQGSILVTMQVWNFRRQPGAAIIGVPLKYSDDLIMTHVSITASLIPGSLVVDSDRVRGILYLHVIGTDNNEDVEKVRQGILSWERRIVRAVGSKSQYRALREDELAARAARSDAKQEAAK
jgi:multicomponent Na+:H+ antiporter subunit E